LGFVFPPAKSAVDGLADPRNKQYQYQADARYYGIQNRKQGFF
jgi:hypothetical protein